MTFVRETEIQQNADLQHGNEREKWLLLQLRQITMG